MKCFAGVVLLLCCGLVRSQGLATPPPADQKTSPYAAEREQAMAPALEAMRQRNYTSALSIFEAVLADYPKDARVLMLASQAARLSGDNAKAFTYLKTAITREPPGHPSWAMHVQIVPMYAAAGDMEKFDSERKLIRDAAASNACFFNSFTSYMIEEIHQGDQVITVLEYPRLYGRFHTRYRFFMPVISAGDWKPYIDCESDDIDQISLAKSHPELAAKGERSFSLDGYPQANMHATYTLFQDGEPSYETVRAVVLKNAAPVSTTTKTK